MVRIRVGTAFALLLLFQQTVALAQPRYEFINIADSTGEFAGFANWRGPAINDHGEVAFFATLDNGDWGVFKGSGGPITTIADKYVVWPFEQQPSINDAGDVAFLGGYFPGLVTPHPSPDSIRVGNGTRLTTIVEKGNQYSQLGLPSISDNGSVAFGAYLKTGARGLYSGEGGVITTIVDTSTLFAYETHWALPPSINAAGDVAFVARYGTAYSAIVATSSGRAYFVTEPSSPPEDIPDLTINDAGVVTRRVSNSRGDIVQLSGERLFFFSPRGNHTIIDHRDPLFGSTVEYLQFYRGFNNRGDVAFGYSLADGRQGIAVARAIPEPASMALAALALVGLAVRFRQR